MYWLLFHPLIICQTYKQKVNETSDTDIDLKCTFSQGIVWTEFCVSYPNQPQVGKQIRQISEDTKSFQFSRVSNLLTHTHTHTHTGWIFVSNLLTHRVDIWFSNIIRECSIVKCQTGLDKYWFKLKKDSPGQTEYVVNMNIFLSF